MYKNPTTSSDSIFKTTSSWIDKLSTYKLWQHIDEYVTNYTSEHQSKLESDWLRKWYFLTNQINVGNKSRDFQVIALSLTSNSDATIKECINVVLDIIPSPREHFSIIEVSMDKGTFKYKIDKYIFTTPKEKRKLQPPPLPVTKKTSNINTANCYVSLQVDDNTDLEVQNTDTVTFADMKLPAVVNEVIL